MATHNKEESDNRNENEDPCKSVVRLVRGFGYPIEVYQNIETEDKYLLDLYRIPYGKTNQTGGSKPVALIVHGFMTSCCDYLVMGPKRSLAFILADRGYDVWLGNPRGSAFSRKHKELDPKTNKEYWNFSFHEIGIYDYPAMFSFIKETTGSTKFSCLATSQATSSFHVLFSEKPEYCSLIKILICMAPVYTIYNMKGPILRVLAKNPILWKPIVNLLGWWYFPTDPMNKLTNYLAGFCHAPGMVQRVVTHILFLVNGYNYAQLNMNEIPLILSHIPNSTSVLHFKHFAQMCLTGEFKQFDYGADGNLKRYGKETPPFYDVSKTACPVALFYSEGGDWICSHLDVNELKKLLPNVVLDHVIEDPNFNHMDFVFAKDVVDLLYKYLCPVLDKYSM